MKVLVAGFPAQDRERISEQLQARGHQALCVGAKIAVTMAPSFQPDWVIVPPGDDGVAVRESLIAVLDGAVFQIANAADAVEGGPDMRPDNQWRRDGKPSGSHRVATPPVTAERAVADVVSMPSSSSEESAAPRQAAPVSAEAIDMVTAPASPPAGGAVPVGLAASRPEPRFVEADFQVGRREPTLTAPDLEAKLEQVRFGDYHSILEVSRAASPFLVREHFDALSRLYNPTGWPHRLSVDEVHHLAEIGQGLREAIAILGHHELRARYESATVVRRR